MDGCMNAALSFTPALMDFGIFKISKSKTKTNETMDE